jgi:signal transduction histidine kinase
MGNRLRMRQRPPILTYGAAILAVLAADGVRITWMPLFGNDTPFLIFFSALALASWFGGMGPGVLATLLGALSVAVLGLLTIRSAGLIDYLHVLHYGVFLATGSLISFLMGRLHGALDRSARAERELELRVQERTEQLVEANRSLHELSGELLNAQETERLRISRELHDDLGQALTLVKLKIGLVDANLEENNQAAKGFCEDASAHVDRAIENMRRLSRDLSPVMVETLGVTIALRRLAEEFNNAGEIRIKSEIAPIDQVLPPGAAILLYRIMQEALNNIVKHSGATVAELKIDKKDGQVCVEVKDNGKGLNLNKKEGSAATGGLGLAIMTERVRTLGSELSIESREGSGTKLQFTIPAIQQKGEKPYSPEGPFNLTDV